MAEEQLRPGLRGVVAAQTRLSGVDGEQGKLLIAGFPVEELAARASFEEVLHLLWRDALPNAGALAELRRALAGRRALSGATLELLRAAAAEQVPTIDALLMGTSSLALERGEEDLEQEALRLVAALPTLVAAYWRLRQGLEVRAPRPELGHVENYLYMLFGQVPSAGRCRALETYVNTVVDHGLNASTFAARVIVATRADLVSAVVGALGALKGPLHGGAPGPVLEMVVDIGRPERAEPYLRAKLERGERLMGFGHRIYKVRDPRADILAAAARALYRTEGDGAFYELAMEVEERAVALLAEYKPGRNLQTNVEFYTALLLHGLGLPAELFTPTFAVGRVGGWTAHCMEQRALEQLIRPTSVYAGARERRWLEVEKR